MPENEEQQEILEKMVAIGELIEQNKTSEEMQVGTINYYKDFAFQGSNLAETDIFVAKIENTQDNTNTYEIYSGKTNNLIATVDEKGKLHFMPEYIESLKQIDPRLVEILNLEDLDFELPQELTKEDRVLTREERTHILAERQLKSPEKDDEKLAKEENEQSEKSPEEEQQEEIAKAKKVPSHNVLVIKENSNLYKDHPELEPNLYFYRDNEGVVRAEYIDSNGEPQPSKYFEPSSTSLRQETVSLGDDGNPVTKEVPYQVMRTKGLNNIDKDIRDVRISVNIDSYGYLELEESRQGRNGEWLSHDIEVKGRDYNSHAVNATTSIYTRKADPDKQTEAYEQVEDTGLEEDGIQYSEMYLIEHADILIEELIREGYTKPEAVKIFDYMIGEEALTMDESKERVNKEIKNKQKQKSKKEVRKAEQEIDEGRTPWGDAEAREARKHS